MGSPIQACRLCGEEAALTASHIIPAFVIRWLKESAATPFLRRAVEPNVARQDMPRSQLLCQNCESLFSGWETEFAERIFFPSRAGGAFSFPYKGWLLRFAVSLAWRVSVTDLEGFKKIQPALGEKVDQATRTWGEFLLGHRRDPGSYEHHIFLMDYLADVGRSAPLHPKTNYYFMRGIDATLVCNSRSAFVYAKPPGIIFCSGVEPPSLDGMTGTLIEEEGTLSSPQQIAHPGLGDFLVDRIELSFREMDKMSDRQRRRILEMALRDPERAVTSESYRAFLADQHLARFRKPR